MYTVRPQNFTIDDAVPARHRRGAELEPVADNRLEIIGHEPLRYQAGLRVSARQIFSGGCGISRSMTRERVAAVFGHLSILSADFRVDQIVRARRRHIGSSSRQGAPGPAAGRCSEFRGPRGDALRALRASARLDASRPPAVKRRHDRQGVDGLFPVAGKVLEYRATGGVGKGLENIVGHSWHREPPWAWVA